jgi:hypothetical protein
MGGDSQMKTIRSPFASQVWVGSDSLEKKHGKNTKLVQKRFTMGRIHKKTSAEHSVGKSSGDGPSLNINWHETSAKNPWPHGIHPKQRTPPFTSSPAEITWKFHRGMQKGPPWSGD